MSKEEKREKEYGKKMRRDMEKWQKEIRNLQDRLSKNGCKGKKRQQCICRIERLEKQIIETEKRLPKRVAICLYA